MSQKKEIEFYETLVIAISARALFDMEKENAVFEKDGLKAYREYQHKNENKLLSQGTAFHLVSSLLRLNETSSDSEKNLSSRHNVK